MNEEIMLSHLSKYLLIPTATIAMLLGLQNVARGAYLTLWDNGSSENRVDIFFLGDGYTAADVDTTYVSHIDAMLQHLFNEGENPYPRYKNFFNVHSVDVISNESGADIPPEGIFRDTALDASYYFDGEIDRLLYINEVKANQVLVDNLPNISLAEIRLVTVNDTRYGGGGGFYAVYAGGNSDATEVALHELGHSFNGLADEYGGSSEPYMGTEPFEINVTQSPTGDKWSHWLGYEQPGIGIIGAYEGARYYDTGLYRPSENSKMRSLGRPFDAVSREKIILDIYNLVNPLDSWLDNTTPLFNPDKLWVDLIDPNVIDINWFVNGTLVSEAEDEWFRLTDYGFGSGIYEVTARAFDSTDWVRINRDVLEQSVSWTVQVEVPDEVAVPEPRTLLGLVGASILTLMGYPRQSSKSRKL
ncbi:MAG: M64 family metallopeptidase [Coleofasciculus sp. S288]|nr:M64 family metallopeptidase [Coleofasciculus sp. S288]